MDPTEFPRNDVEHLLDSLVEQLSQETRLMADRIRELDLGIRRHRMQSRIIEMMHVDERGVMDDIGVRMLDEACRDLWLLVSEEIRNESTRDR
jgi:hypothetical protein